MSPAQDVDVRVQGFVRGVGLVQLWSPARTDWSMVRRQARYWSAEQIEAWRRWTNIGMNTYLLFFVLAAGAVCWLVIATGQDGWGAFIPVLHLAPPILALRYKQRRGWL